LNHLIGDFFDRKYIFFFSFDFERKPLISYIIYSGSDVRFFVVVNYIDEFVLLLRK
jgi:hypothetical protein